jgi:hemolysin III
MFNVLTHGLAFVLSAVAAFIMVEEAWTKGSALHVFTFTVYGLAWVALFGASTLYHQSQFLEHKRTLRIIDHCMIFIVIAASYGPYMAHVVGGVKGYLMWTLVWIIAIAGSLFKWFSKNRYGFYSTAAYFAQGMLVLTLFPTLCANMDWPGVGWLLMGGAMVGFGVPLYDWESVNFHHGIWHLCVLTGGFCFWCSVVYSVLPASL